MKEKGTNNYNKQCAWSKFKTVFSGDSLYDRSPDHPDSKRSINPDKFSFLHAQIIF